MKAAEFIRREGLFITAVTGLILILIYIGIQEGGAGEQISAGTVPSFTLEELKEAMESGRVHPLVLELISLLVVIFITFFIAGLILNLAGLIRKNWRVFAPGFPPRVEWGIWPVVKVLVYFIFLLFFFQILQSVIMKELKGEVSSSSPSLLIFNAIFQDLLIIILVCGFLRKFNFSRSVFPINLHHPYPSFRQGIRGYVFFFPVLISLILISYIASRLLGRGFDSHPLVEPLIASDNPFLLAGLFAIAIGLAPLVEEIFFRGFLYPALKKKTSVPVAILLSATLFSTLHFSVSGWLPILGLGALLAYSYEKTGNLLVPIIIHALHNFLFLSYAVLAHQVAEVFSEKAIFVLQ